MTLTRHGISVQTHDWLPDELAIRRAIQAVERLERRKQTLANKIAREAQRQALKREAA